MKEHWIIKMKNPYNHLKVVIYNDGRVYLDGGELIGNLKTRFMKKISFYINEYMYYVKRYGYMIYDENGYITKFWDSSRKKRNNLAVKGWIYEKELLEILIKPKSYRKIHINEQDLFRIMYDFLESK